MSEGHDEAEQGRRWIRAVVIAVLVVIVVFVLFEWVFPWVTEMGLSPTMD